MGIKVKNQIIYNLSQNKIQYLIQSNEGFKVSSFFDLSNINEFKENLSKEVTNIQLFSSNVYVWLDNSFYLTQVLNLPKMSSLKAKHLVTKELKLMYKDLLKYHVQTSMKMNSKKYLDIFVEMIPKDILISLNEVTKDLKLGKNKALLAKDIMFQSFGDSPVIFLNKLENILSIFYKNQQQSMLIDGFNLISSLDILFSYYKLSKDEIDQFKFYLLTNDNSEEDKLFKNTKVEWIKLSYQEYIEILLKNYLKVKGF